MAHLEMTSLRSTTEFPSARSQKIHAPVTRTSSCDIRVWKTDAGRFIAAQRVPDKTHYKSIFVSDTHLGTKGCKAEVRLLLAAFANQRDAPLPDDAQAIGTEIISISVNHDEFLQRYSNLAPVNTRLVDEAVHKSADGRRLLDVHGELHDVDICGDWIESCAALV